MPRPSRLQIAKADIISQFDDLAAQYSIFRTEDIWRVLEKNRDFWRLAKRTTANELIRFLEEKASLRRITLRAEHHDKKVIRYVWGQASPYELALSLKQGAYLTHATAVFLHGLTDLIPKTIYVNQEQSAKPSGNSLTQEGINRAFANKQRVSRLSYRFEDVRIVVTQGKHTGRLGVESVRGPEGRQLDVTTIERTLIDIAVRPVYAGGIVHVLDAYGEAKERVSVNRLKAILKKLDYAYPYHQAIGFLMERAGYEEHRYGLLRELDQKFDFYLTHDMKDPQYIEKWRLFVPQGLERLSQPND